MVSNRLLSLILCHAGDFEPVMRQVLTHAFKPEHFIKAADGVPHGASASVHVGTTCTVKGFINHPAVMDACLHLSATAMSQTSGLPAKTHVPAGFNCLSITRTSGGPLPARLRREASTAPSAPASDGSFTCSFHLCGPSAPKIDIHHLISKAMPDLPGASEAVPAQSMPSEMMFEVEEQALQPTPAAFGAPRSAMTLRAVKRATPFAAGGDASPSAQGVHVLAADAGLLARKPAAVGLAHVIGALQNSLRNGGRGLQIRTVTASLQAAASVSSAQDQTGILGRALWGMLRAASTELPTLTWSGTARSAALPPSFGKHDEDTGNVRTCPKPLSVLRKVLGVLLTVVRFDASALACHEN